MPLPGSQGMISSMLEIPSIRLRILNRGLVHLSEVDRCAILASVVSLD